MSTLSKQQQQVTTATAKNENQVPSLHSIQPNQVKEMRIYFESVSNGNRDKQLANSVEVEAIKRDINEILHFKGTTTQWHPDGSIGFTPHYLDLPNEIVSLIVHHIKQQQHHQKDLFQYALINQQFYSEINPILWSEPKLNNTAILDRFLNCLADARASRTANLICTLDLGGGSFWTDSKLLLLMPYIRQLKIFQMNNGPHNITTVSLNYLPRHCQHLASLYLNHMTPSPAFFQLLGQHCQQLNKLALMHCPNLPSNIFKLLESCPLRSLALVFDDGDTTNSMEDAMAMDIKRFASLVKLKVIHLSKDIPRSLLTKSNHHNIWPHLKRLHLKGCSNMDNTLLIEFIDSHRELHCITLCRSRFTDTFLQKMASSLPHLTHLALHGNQNITLEVVYQLIRHCRRLKWADFYQGQSPVPNLLPFANRAHNRLTFNETEIKKIRRE